MSITWGNAIGPLQLVANSDLSRASINKFHKFNGDGKISTDENIMALFFACSVVCPQHENVAMRMFVETLVENITE